MRPCLKSTPSFTGSSSSSSGLSFTTLSSCTPSTSGSCLGTTPACRIRKCVAFEADACLETVFVADEWDRTPTEPARKLSYQDLLELKEIQRSLPRANQPPDHLAGRAGKQYLSTVPIGLLPLLPSNSPVAPPPSIDPSPTSSNATSPATPSFPSRSDINAPQNRPRSNWTPIQSPTSPTSPIYPSIDPSGETRWVSFNPDSPRDPGSLAATSPPVVSPLHVARSQLSNPMSQSSSKAPNHSAPQAPSNLAPPPSAEPAKQKPRFAFLPLLDSPPPTADTPSSPSPSTPTLKLPIPRHPSSGSSSNETNASTSKWSSKAYSTGEADPPFFQLPPPRRAQRGPQGAAQASSGTTNGSRFSAYYNREGGDWEEQRQHRSFGSAMSGRQRSKSPPGGTSFGRSHPAFQAVYPAGTTLSPSSSRASSRHPSPARPEAKQAPPPISEKKKNVMVINGIEYDLGGDDDEPVPPPKEKKKKNVMVINGVEVDLGDDDEEEETPLTPVSTKAPSLPPSSPVSSYQPSSPIAQPRPISPAVSSRSPSTSPKSGSTRGPNGLPTPPPSTSPSPVPSWRDLPVEEPESPFVGLHAPVTFKRAPRPAAPAPAPSIIPQFKGAPQPLGLAISTAPFKAPSPSSPTCKTPTPSSPVTRGRSGSVSSVGGSPSRVRRGSVCGQQSQSKGGMGFDPRASPRLVPRA